MKREKIKLLCFFQTIYSHEKETEVFSEMDKVILKFLQNCEGFRTGQKMLTKK